QLLIFVVFFFQAEDGIRDYKVTGVQTCALPISIAIRIERRTTVRYATVRGRRSCIAAVSRAAKRLMANCSHKQNNNFCESTIDRSEERRVGKECRSRWASNH